jgi:hypothetical protein
MLWYLMIPLVLVALTIAVAPALGLTVVHRREARSGRSAPRRPVSDPGVPVPPAEESPERARTS